MQSQSALKSWIKHNGGPSTQVPIKGCANVDDFSKKVKKELSTKRQVALYSSLEKEPIKSWLTMDDLLAMEGLKNSGESPLFVKLIPIQDSLASKTIYIRDIDDGKFTGKYMKYKVKNKEDLRDIYKNGKGLIHLSDPGTAIVSFDEIKDGEKMAKEGADAMEAETLLSMKAFLEEKFQASPINLSTDFLDKEGRQVQEWDGVLLSKGILYLLEAKHAMTVEKIKTIAERVEQFPKMIEQSSKVFDVKYSKIVVVACGTLFPIDCCDEAHRLGLMVMYPSGSRYGLDEKYIIES